MYSSGNTETFNLTRLPFQTLILESGRMEPYWDEFVILDSVYSMAYASYKRSSVCFNDELIVRMWKVYCVDVFDVALCFLESL